MPVRALHIVRRVSTHQKPPQPLNLFPPPLSPCRGQGRRIRWGRLGLRRWRGGGRRIGAADIGRQPQAGWEGHRQCGQTRKTTAAGRSTVAVRCGSEGGRQSTGNLRHYSQASVQVRCRTLIQIVGFQNRGGHVCSAAAQPQLGGGNAIMMPS